MNGGVRSSEGGISVTTPIDQDTYIGQQFGVNEPLNGSISEIIVFDSVLTDSQIMSIQAYLANKWNLTSIVDSDGDGFTDAVEIAAGSDPTDVASNLLADFSDAVTAEIGATSGVESIESKLALWFDASNTDSIEKDANYRISQWKDLSGNDHHISQDTASDRPLLVDKIINNKAMIQFHNDGGEYFDQIN